MVKFSILKKMKMIYELIIVKSIKVIKINYYKN